MKQLGCHAHGWAGPSGTENKTLFQEKTRNLPMSPTHKLTFVYSVFGARLVGDQKAVFICLCGGRVTTNDSSREGLRIKDSDHLYVYVTQSVTVQKERGGAGLPLETAGISTHCASLMATLSLFLYPGASHQGAPADASFPIQKKISHDKSSLSMPDSPPTRDHCCFLL